MPRTPVTDETVPSSVVVVHAPALQGNNGDGPEMPPALSLAEDAVLEALLDQLISEQDAWGYLNGIRDHQVPQENRQRYYGGFIALVAPRPEAERDALINAGQPVFKYRADTARRDVKAIRDQGAAQTMVSPSVITDEIMAEIVYNPVESGHRIKYLVYRHETGEMTVEDMVVVNGTTHVPPQTSLVDFQTLLLPSGVEEYGEQVNLLQDVREFITSYLYIEDARFVEIIAYYVLLTWIYDKFEVVPYLRSQGEFASGKTRLLQVVGGLSMRAIMAGGATTASPIFRIISRFKGTLLIDEADFSDSDMWSETIKILNVGYLKGFAVLRSERGGAGNDNFDVMGYDCFGPKILSTRKRFSDQALESRCLSYTMSSTGSLPAHIPLFLGPEFREQALVLRNKLLLWRFRHFRSATADPYARFEGLDSRLNQILIPLLSCSTDETIRAQILEHARAYQSSFKEDIRESFEGITAFALLQRFRATKTPNLVHMKEVTEYLRQEYADTGLKVEPRRIGEICRHTFGLKTVNKGGSTWVQITKREATGIAKRYSIPRETFTTDPEKAIKTPVRVH